MECHSVGLFGQLLLDFKGLGDIVPNLYISIRGASHDKLLSDTGVETCNLLSVEGTVNIIKLWLGLCPLVKRNVDLEKLILVRDQVYIVL